MSKPHWIKIEEGYELTSWKVPALLIKQKGRWFLQVADRRYDLGRRGSFNHAERILLQEHGSKES
jgi:hypothetical protein